MLAEEAHWLGEPCHHAVVYYERKRLARIEARNREAMRGKTSCLSRSLFSDGLPSRSASLLSLVRR